MSAQETRAQIAHLSNDRLVQLREQTTKLHQEVGYSRFDAQFAGHQSQELETLRREINELKAALDQGYTTRVFRGYRARLEKLQRALRPGQQEVAGRRLIPINGAAVQGKEAHQQDALQNATALAEQLCATLVAISGETTAATTKAPTTEQEGRNV
jgi:hypothetical protein